MHVNSAHLSDRWKADESNSCYTRPGDIEAETTAASPSTGRTDELSSEFSELGFQLSQVIARRLVLLRWQSQLTLSDISDKGGKEDILRFYRTTVNIPFCATVSVHLPSHLRFPGECEIAISNFSHQARANIP